MFIFITCCFIIEDQSAMPVLDANDKFNKAVFVGLEEEDEE
jgi:hypothetical protein